MLFLVIHSTTRIVVPVVLDSEIGALDGIVILSLVILAINHRRSLIVRFGRAQSNRQTVTIARPVGAKAPRTMPKPKRLVSATSAPLSSSLTTPVSEVAPVAQTIATPPAPPPQSPAAPSFAQAAYVHETSLPETLTPTQETQSTFRTQIATAIPLVKEQPVAAERDRAVSSFAATGRWLKPETAVPGWYVDPSGAANSLRYFDGAAWTDHVARRT